MLLLDQVELLLKHLYLLCILPEQCIFRIFVNLWLIFDPFGSVSVPQSAQCFFVRGARWADISNHASLDIASKRVLKKACQLGITIRYVFRLAID